MGHKSLCPLKHNYTVKVEEVENFITKLKKKKKQSEIKPLILFPGIPACVGVQTGKPG